jgi:putative NIF3 family GTP cyclohydrolase 1 type 2
MITLEQAYKLFLKMAKERGPRSIKEIEAKLKKINKDYDALSKEKKKFFDTERLKNPFSDSRILVGDAKKPLKRIMVGIDIMVGEILLANELSKMGKKIDAVLAHHPEGRALIDLTQVMDVHEDLAIIDGIPINVAEKLTKGRISDIDRSLHPSNHFQMTQAADLLGLPFACFHTFADNQCYWFLKNHIDKKKPMYLSEIIDALLEIPEYQEASRLGNEPKIFCGSDNSRVGKISYSGITGGTSGSKEMYEKMSQAGVGTIIAMHMNDEHRRLAEEFHLNVIVASHMASDSLGMNILLDELEKEKVEIVPAGGFIRVSRAKSKKKN